MNDFQNKYPSEHLLKIIQSSHDAFIVSDHDLKIVYSNKTAQNIFGYSEKEMEGLSILELMPEDRRINYTYDIESALKSDTVTNVNTAIDLFGQRKNGKAFPIELTYTYYIFDNKNFFVSQIRDISEKKDREKELNTLTTALRVMTEVNRLLVDSNDDDEANYLNKICSIITETGRFPRSSVSLVKDTPEGDKIICNLAHSGYQKVFPPQEFLLSGLHPESLTAIVVKEKRTDICNDIIGRNLWKYWVDNPCKIEFESTIAVPVILKNDVGGILRVFSKEPFYFSEDKVRLLEELAKDISHGITFIRTKLAHNDALKALEESERKYKDLFNSNNDAIVIVDAESGVILDANLKSEDLLKVPLEKIIGTHYTEFIIDGYEKRYRDLIKANIEKEISFTDEFYLKTRSSGGKAIPIQVSSSLATINGRKILQSIFRDISQSRFHEENMRTVQKMEALGTLSGGIAHDINNILSPVIGFTQLAILEFEDKEKQNNYLNEVLTAANRAKELVSQILTFCRKSETDKKQHNIQNIMREVIKLISISLPPNVELQTVIDDSCDPILCDPVQIYQVVINLCTNAYQAMKDTGGVLKVCLVRKGSPEIKIEQSEKLPFDNYICLIVSDTGCGMTKTTFNRIFEPYFTTKPKEEGTGLGLSVVSGIVKEHGGEIYVRTYPKEGTYFKISFPTVSFFAENKESKHGVPAESKFMNILVVDDELQITFMMKHMLEELGYSSETYNDPESAYIAFKKDPLKYDMVITDQTMPKILGTDLSRKILEIRPETPIILNTGFSPVTSKSEAKKLGIKEFIMKPITISELSAAIEKALKKI